MAFRRFLSRLKTRAAPAISVFQDAPRIVGYGRDDTEILVARRDGTAENDAAARRIHAPETQAVILTDHDDTGAILAGLQKLEQIQTPNVSQFSFGASFKDSQDFSECVADKLAFGWNNCCYRDGTILVDLPMPVDLVNDTRRAVEALTPAFDLAARSFKTVFAFTRTPDQLTWHLDFGEPDEKKMLAVRCFEDAGTLVALKDYGERDGRYFKNMKSAGHAGQGLYILRGDTAHSTPVLSSPRWITQIVPTG